MNDPSRRLFTRAARPQTGAIDRGQRRVTETRPSGPRGRLGLHRPLRPSESNDRHVIDTRCQPATMPGTDPLLKRSHAARPVRADACGRAPGANGRGSHFRHESLFYSGPDAFLAGTLPLIDRTLEREGPVLVAAREANLELLRDALGERAGGVRFADMRVLGRNPARIISAWHQFLEAAASRGAPALGVAEPIWPGRSVAELTE